MRERIEREREREETERDGNRDGKMETVLISKKRKGKESVQYGYTYTCSVLTRTFLLTSTLCLPQMPRIGQ